VTSLTDEELPLDALLLDPNNYRFQDYEDFVQADDRRFHEESVQARTYARLRAEGLDQLKRSILTNGFLPFERLVVEPYEHAEGKYVVIEGNRRVAALRMIAQEHAAGVTVPQEVQDVLTRVPVIVVSNANDDPVIRLALMGVRHVGGIRQWGAYQRAKLVTELRDEFHLDTGEVASRLAMTAHEVNRRYRAFKALRQMEEDEDYQDQAEPDLYPLFHEAIAGQAIKDWLGWNEAAARFTNDEELHRFYDLITPKESEEGDTEAPRLPTREAVRELRLILPVQEARTALFNGDRSFYEALALAKADELKRSWIVQVAEAIKALESVSAVELQRISAEDLGEVERVKAAAENLMQLHERITR
jgi:ParB-like chromosome segregation protein Spo0J